MGPGHRRGPRWPLAGQHGAGRLVPPAQQPRLQGERWLQTPLDRKHPEATAAPPPPVTEVARTPEDKQRLPGMEFARFRSQTERDLCALPQGT